MLTSIRTGSFTGSPALYHSESDGAKNQGQSTRERRSANRTARRRVVGVRIEAVVEGFLTDKGKGQRGESGNYRQDAGREFSRFVDFLADALTESDDTHWIFAIIP